MNPYSCRIVLRPRGPLDVFDLTLRFFRLSLSSVARLAAWTLLPLALIVLGIWFFAGPWWAVGALALLLPVVRAPFTVLGGQLLFAADVPTWDVLRTTSRLAGELAQTWLVLVLVWLLIGCSGIGVLLLGVIVWLPEAALLERVDIGRGLRRTSLLATARPAHALLGALSGIGLSLFGALLGEQVGQVLVGFVLQLGQPFGSIWDGTVTPYALLGTLALQPISVWYRLFLYVDCRTQIEGWDLQVGLRALDLGSPK